MSWGHLENKVPKGFDKLTECSEVNLNKLRALYSRSEWHVLQTLYVTGWCVVTKMKRTKYIIHLFSSFC